MIDGLICPHCNSVRLNKSGFMWSGRNKRQRYTCLDCHRATIIPTFVNKETEAKLSEGEAPVSRNIENNALQC
jgi:transposase-like protein